MGQDGARRESRELNSADAPRVLLVRRFEADVCRWLRWLEKLLGAPVQEGGNAVRA